MAANPGIVLQGRSRGLLSLLLLSIAVHITTSGIPALAADDQAACSTPFARIVSIQGSVEVLRADRSGVGQSGAGPRDASRWLKVTRLDTVLCEGDRLRTGALSRAALFIQPETLVRVDQHTRISISQAAEETLVEFIQEEILPTSATGNACGAGYFITRFPRKFKVNTPHLNAAVEGTEFLVAMRCEATDLSVFEGKVLAASAGTDVFPPQTISSGQTLTIGGAEPPAIKLLVKPADAVQWVLYYPPITPLDANIETDCRAVLSDQRAPCLVARAERLLRAGNVEEARIQINDAIAVAPLSSDATALQSIISLVRNERSEAFRFAYEAVKADSSSPPAWLALSYAQQSDFKLEAALTSAQKAVEITPNNSLALVRVAELQLSLGWNREAEKTAKQAVAANEFESRTHMILGFVHLAEIQVEKARTAFERAIELDSTEPLSRLGLGLAIIRTGNLAEGREQIEIAVALDPTNSLLRSYVGKAYYEENTKERDRLAATQYEHAKQLDPNDPTPWFYSAMLKRTQNKPVEALEELQESSRLNDNRAVYRSRLSLDEDTSARAATIARTYGELHFDQLALLEGTKTLNIDPAGSSGHRFLADAYLTLPRHDIARVSELLQSQMRQPIGLNPVQPQFGDTKNFIPSDSGPARRGLNEFNTLFAQNGLAGWLDVMVAGNDTFGNQAVIAGLNDRIGWSLGQFHYETDGVRTNNDLTRDIGSALIQIEPTDFTSIQGEFRHTEAKYGDLPLRFDPHFVLPTRNTETIENSRIGMRQVIDARSDVLISAINQEFQGTSQLFDTLQVNGHTTMGEAQYYVSLRRQRVMAGAGLFEGERRDSIDGLFDITSATRHKNAYVYYWVDPIPSVLTIQLGVSHDEFDSERLGKTQYRTNPKLGIVWLPRPSTTVRFAAFETLKRTLTNNQTLEPTQVAGFNQFFDDADGTRAKKIGLGIDERFGSRAFAGFEVSQRELDIPHIDFFTGFPVFSTWREDQGRAYAYWAVSKQLTLSADAIYERMRRTLDNPGDEQFLTVETQRFPVRTKYATPSGWTYLGQVQYVKQRGEFFELLGTLTPGSSKFVKVDIGATYRAPERRGQLSFEIRNLLNEEYQFQETDLGNPVMSQGTLLLVRWSLILQ